MTAAAIIALIVLGLALIFLEIFLIPGTTVFGVAGGVALITGIILVYTYFGSTYGHIALGASSVSVLLAIVAGFKLIQSNTLAMKAQIDSKVNNEDLPGILKGEQGTTITDLRPNGKAQFGNQKVDVYSTGDFIDRNTTIEVVRIQDQKIFVKPINT